MGQANLLHGTLPIRGRLGLARATPRVNSFAGQGGLLRTWMAELNSVQEPFEMKSFTFAEYEWRMAELPKGLDQDPWTQARLPCGCRRGCTGQPCLRVPRRTALFDETAHWRRTNAPSAIERKYSFCRNRCTCSGFGS